MVDITPVLEIAIAFCAALITVFVIPWVKEKMGAEQTKELLQWVKIAVAAAEQLYNATEGSQKKAYVVHFLEDKGYSVDYESLDNAIEAAVLELHNTLYGVDSNDRETA